MRYLLSHRCYTLVTLVLHCCHPVVTLLVHYFITPTTLLLHCYCAVATLLSHRSGSIGGPAPDALPKICIAWWCDNSVTAV
jgi:hypothetical protein